MPPRRFWAYYVLLMLVLTVAAVSGQQVTRLTLVAQPADSRDTADHIDLTPGMIAVPLVLSAYDRAGNAVSPAHVVWASDRTTVAQVHNGYVLGKEEGLATITARVGTVTASLTACVVKVPKRQLLVKDDSVGTARLGTRFFVVEYMHAVDTAMNSKQRAWGPCVHWYSSAPRSEVIPKNVTLSRRGVAVIERLKGDTSAQAGFWPIATIGVRMPWDGAFRTTSYSIQYHMFACAW